MAKHAAVWSCEGPAMEHAAARAWRAFAPSAPASAEIAILKETAHSAVYRLESAGRAGTAIIAKRSSSAGISMECAVYQRILTHCPVVGLRVFGVLPERGPGGATSAWLFLEDAGGERYSPDSAEHRTLAGEWLGALHASAARIGATACLPDRGTGYYVIQLRCVCDALERSLSSGPLEAVLTACRLLESRWSDVEQWASRMPPTLVHGDLAPKNARVRTDRSGASFLVFDWGGAGRGCPAADLAQFTANSLSPDLPAWSAAAREWCPEALKPARLARLGRIFRLILALRWESERLSTPWPEGAIRRITAFGADLAALLQPSVWRSDGSAC
jgi:Phosphotransferase enzyme family